MTEEARYAFEFQIRREGEFHPKENKDWTEWYLHYIRGELRFKDTPKISILLNRIQKKLLIMMKELEEEL